MQHTRPDSQTPRLIFLYLYFLHPLMHHVTKVHLGTINTTTDYKPNVEYFSYFIFIPLHVSICQDHHQVAFL
jgi:hypothetical protein